MRWILQWLILHLQELALPKTVLSVKVRSLDQEIHWGALPRQTRSTWVNISTALNGVMQAHMRAPSFCMRQIDLMKILEAWSGPSRKHKLKQRHQNWGCRLPHCPWVVSLRSRQTFCHCLSCWWTTQRWNEDRILQGDHRGANFPRITWRQQYPPMIWGSIPWDIRCYPTSWPVLWSNARLVCQATDDRNHRWPCHRIAPRKPCT